MIKHKSGIRNRKQAQNPKSQSPKQKNSRPSLFGYLALFIIWNLYIGTCNAYALDLDKLKIYFLEGEYKQAIFEGEKILAGSRHCEGLDELYYFMGLSYLKEENYLRASDIFEIILNEFKKSKFREAAKLGLGDTYFLRGDFLKARDCYQGLIKDNPQSKFLAPLYYRLSQIAFKKSDTQAAGEYLDKLKREFPANPDLILNKDLYLVTDISTGLYYSIQVGAFSRPVNAQNLRQKLAQKGYPAYIEEVNNQGKHSYRVRIGKFSMRQEAVEIENKLSQEGYPAKIYP